MFCSVLIRTDIMSAKGQHPRGKSLKSTTRSPNLQGKSTNLVNLFQRLTFCHLLLAAVSFFLLCSEIACTCPQRLQNREGRSETPPTPFAHTKLVRTRKMLQYAENVEVLHVRTQAWRGVLLVGRSPSRVLSRGTAYLPSLLSMCNLPRLHRANVERALVLRT